MSPNAPLISRPPAFAPTPPNSLCYAIVGTVRLVAPTKRSVASDPASGAQASSSSKPEALSDGGSTDQPTPVLDPLNQLLDRPEAAGLVEAALGEAETGTLTLQLTPAFDRLSDSERRRRAELWQRWALELGYDHLDLRDRRAGLRGRDALVGDGMILFSPQLPT